VNYSGLGGWTCHCFVAFLLTAINLHLHIHIGTRQASRSHPPKAIPPRQVSEPGSTISPSRASAANNPRAPNDDAPTNPS
jgi:hypothetical protein